MKACHLFVFLLGLALASPALAQRGAGGHGQITTGRLVLTRGGEVIEPINAGRGDANGGPGLCFDIYTRKFAGIALRTLAPVGVMCSNGTTARAPFKPLHETFIWYSNADAWKEGQSLYLKYKSGTDARKFTVSLTKAKRVDQFNNEPRCKTGSMKVPQTGTRYQAKGRNEPSIVLVRSESTLSGYWSGTECDAVEPATDGWISLEWFSGSMIAHAWGTAR